jgi:hypothetical protein
MFKVLNAYLFQRRNVSIPGVGTLYLETTPATANIADRTILPPAHRFRLDRYLDAPEKEFFSYLATQRNMLDFEAIKWYTEFSVQLRNRIRTEERVEWDGLGAFTKDESGNTIFEATADQGVYMAPVPALRVNRQHAPHVLLVGDQEKTNFEMNEWLHDEAAVRRNRRTWWIIALVLALAGMALLVWHISVNGWSIGNQQKL